MIIGQRATTIAVDTCHTDANSTVTWSVAWKSACDRLPNYLSFAMSLGLCFLKDKCICIREAPSKRSPYVTFYVSCTERRNGDKVVSMELPPDISASEVVKAKDESKAAYDALKVASPAYNALKAASIWRAEGSQHMTRWRLFEGLSSRTTNASASSWLGTYGSKSPRAVAPSWVCLC